MSIAVQIVDVGDLEFIQHWIQCRAWIVIDGRRYPMVIETRGSAEGFMSTDSGEGRTVYDDFCAAWAVDRLTSGPPRNRI